MKTLALKYIRILCFILGLNGLFMIPAFLAARYFGEREESMVFLWLGLPAILVGFTLYGSLPRPKQALKNKDLYLLITFGWILSLLIGTLPYLFSGHISSFIDALFQSTAGYTTTNASVIDESLLPRSLFLWKAINHWIGGLATLVMVISILPLLGFHGQRMAFVEVPHSIMPKLGGRIYELDKIIFGIYSSLTCLEFLLLWIGSDLSAFSSLIAAMGGISTAGIMVPQEMGLAYGNPYVTLVLSFFSLIGALNIFLSIYLWRRSFREILHNLEFRYFLLFVAIATILISLSLKGNGYFDSFLASLYHSFIQVTAFATTSGYAFNSYVDWPFFTQFFLMMLLFIGGCAGSTGGGFKMIRFLVMGKLVLRGFIKRIHPRAIYAVRIGDRSVSAPTVSTVAAFIPLFLFIFLLSALILSLQGLDIETTLFTALSLLSTSGLGSGQLGIHADFSLYSDPLRLFMCFIMLLGRLDIVTVVLMFLPSFWNIKRFKLK